MSNYTPSTNFATKDALSTGDPLKIVRGTEINTEFTNIAVAVATKLDTTALASPGPIGATTPAAINGTTGTFSGNVQMASANGGPLAGLRNKIINGNMRVAQRGAIPFTVSLPPTGSPQYTADRFGIDQSTTAPSAAARGGIFTDNALGGSSSTHIYLETVTTKATLAASDYALIQQNIEGFNVADLKYGTASAKTVTISFRAAIGNAGSSAVICVSIRNGAVNRSYVVPVTITSSAASYSVTIPGDTTGTWLINSGLGMRVGFCAGAGTTYQTTGSTWTAGGFIATSTQTNILGMANATLAITDVQLEIGPVATPFEQRPIGMELALCQRYYVHNTQAYLQGYITTSGFLSTSTSHPVPLRATPTITTITNLNSNISSTTFTPQPTNTITQGAGTAVGVATLNVYFSASAEL